MSLGKLLDVALLAATISCGSSQAAMIQTKFSGNLSEGRDYDHLFSPAIGLYGAPFELIFTIDTDRVSVVNDPDNDPSISYLKTDVGYAFTVDLAVFGTRYSFADMIYSAQSIVQFPAFNQVGFNARASNISAGFGIQRYSTPENSPTDVLQSYSFNDQMPLDADYLVYFYIPNNRGQYAAEGYFLGSAGAVPEPSTWAMILLGFVGLATIAMRRRQGKRLKFV